MIRFRVNPLWCSMGLGGGDVGEHGSDNEGSSGGSPGGGSGSGRGAAERASRDMSGRSMNDMSAAEMAGRGGGTWGSDYGSSVDMTNVKSMLKSPTAADYNAYYANKLGVMGTPGATWDAFTSALSRIRNYWGNTLGWGVKDMVGKVSDMPGQVANALGFSDEPAAIESTVGPINADMSINTLDIPDVDATKLGMALSGIAQSRLPTDEEMGVVSGIMAEKGLLGPIDLAGMKAAGVAGKVVGQAVTPMASIGALKAGLDLTNPAVQKAMGIGIDTFGNLVSRSINAQTIAERASGTGIAAGKAGTVSREANAMGERSGRDGREQRVGDLAGVGKLDSFNAFLNQGGYARTTSRGEPSASGSGNVNPSASGSGNVNTGGGQKEGSAPPPPMAKRQRGSRLGLPDYMTLTDDLGAGSESVELRNRMLGGV